MLARSMAVIALVYAVLAIFVSVLVSIAPEVLLALKDSFVSAQGRYLSAAFSLFIAAVFILASPVVKFPLFFKVLGGYALIAGIATLIVSNHVWAEMLDFWLVENLFVYRTIGTLVGITVMAFVVQSSLPVLKK